MGQTILALLGVVIGFILPSLASYIKSRTIGARFENAVKSELEDAKDNLHRKMLWISRDQSQFKSHVDDWLLAEYDGKLLYLGEEEDFSISIPFWEQNIRAIVEATSTKSFNKMCREVFLIRKFVSKFREMKLGYKVSAGDPKRMALACYEELVKIHNEVAPDKSLQRNNETA